VLTIAILSSVDGSQHPLCVNIDDLIYFDYKVTKMMMLWDGDKIGKLSTFSPFLTRLAQMIGTPLFLIKRETFQFHSINSMRRFRKT